MRAASWFLPGLFSILGMLFLFGGGRFLDAFLRGVKDGMKHAVGLFPTMLLFVCAVSLFRASGCVALLCRMFAPVCAFLHIPTDLLPLLIIRPVSGSAATAVLSDLFSVHNADSAIGMAASVLAGSSETMLYVIAVYCAVCGRKHTRHVFPASALTAVFVTALSLLLVRLAGYL